MEDPCHPNYPQALKDTGRSAQHGPLLGDGRGRPNRATALGQDRQAEDRGCRSRSVRNGWKPSMMKSSTTRSSSLTRPKKDGKPFFLWLNPTRMHVVTHLSEKYREDADPGERLVHPGSWNGAARRHRRRGHGVCEGQRSRREHDHCVFDRQRRRELYLARRRPDTVRRRQGTGA